MDATSFEDLRRTYLVARLNVEKSERSVGHLARVLARHAMVLRLATIATAKERAPASRDDDTSELPPVPFEVSDALRELRAWRDAARDAYRQIPEAERGRIALPQRPWSSRRCAAEPGLA
jgi:hypothetical protein